LGKIFLSQKAASMQLGPPFFFSHASFMPPEVEEALALWISVASIGGQNLRMISLLISRRSEIVAGSSIR
jgi:hypothetical protein